MVTGSGEFLWRGVQSAQMYIVARVTASHHRGETIALPKAIGTLNFPTVADCRDTLVGLIDRGKIVICRNGNVILGPG